MSSPTIPSCFTKFQDLPPELRDKIWEQATPDAAKDDDIDLGPGLWSYQVRCWKALDETSLDLADWADELGVDIEPNANVLAFAHFKLKRFCAMPRMSALLLVNKEAHAAVARTRFPQPITLDKHQWYPFRYYRQSRDAIYLPPELHENFFNSFYRAQEAITVDAEDPREEIDIQRLAVTTHLLSTACGRWHLAKLLLSLDCIKELLVLDKTVPPPDPLHPSWCRFEAAGSGTFDMRRFDSPRVLTPLTEAEQKEKKRRSTYRKGTIWDKFHSAFPLLQPKHEPHPDVGRWEVHYCPGAEEATTSCSLANSRKTDTTKDSADDTIGGPQTGMDHGTAIDAVGTLKSDSFGRMIDQLAKAFNEQVGDQVPRQRGKLTIRPIIAIRQDWL